MDDNNTDIEYVLPVEKKEEKPKKKKLAFILVAVVVLVIAVGLIVIFAMPQSISGTWQLTVNPEIATATADQITERDRAYYTFSEPGEYGDGTFEIFYDGGAEKGEYKLSKKNGKKYINLSAGDLEYEITGTKLFGTAKLTIIMPTDTDENSSTTENVDKYCFEQAPKVDYQNTSYDEYKTDKKLLCKWITNERVLEYYHYQIPYVQTVEFFSNGVMTINYKSDQLYLDRTMYYAYTVDNSKLTFSLVTDLENKNTVSYKFDKENLVFENDKTNCSIFADHVFADFTYKKEQNLSDTQPKSQESTQ